MAKVDLGQVVGADGKDALIDETVTGKIASFSDGCAGMPMKSIVAEITPVQSGSGDPSPTNIRPISGRTGLTVTACGVNIWDEQWRLGAYNGTTGEYVQNTANLCSKNDIGVKPNTSYYFCTPKAMYLFEYAADGSFLGYTTILNNVYTTKASTAYIRFYLLAGYGTTYANDISINCPSTDTSYHAYTGHTYPITWESIAGTVYGGTLDVVSGVLTVDKVLIDLGSITNWRYNIGNTGAFDTNGNLNPIAKNNDCICTNYKTLETPTAGAITGGDMLVAINKKNDGTKYTGTYADGTLIVKDSRYSDVESFKAAMNGVMLCYTLATPQTYQLTPTEVRTILGVNNLWSDAGDVSVEYIADTKMYIDKRLNTTRVMIAGVETSFVATKNYAIGDFVIVNDTLYRITAVITSGETITPGTNASETTVAEQLIALYNA